LAFQRHSLLQTWIRTYARLLRWAENDQRFMLVDSDQLLQGEGRGELEAFVECELDFTQIDPNVRRSKKTVTDDSRWEAKASRLHRQLQAASQRYLSRPAGRNGVVATS
jgi:hypothetical protein